LIDNRYNQAPTSSHEIGIPAFPERPIWNLLAARWLTESNSGGNFQQIPTLRFIPPEELKSLLYDINRAPETDFKRYPRIRLIRKPQSQ
jgi:hypothetical protein